MAAAESQSESPSLERRLELSSMLLSENLLDGISRGMQHFDASILVWMVEWTTGPLD